MNDLYLNRRSILTLDELKGIFRQTIDPTSKLAEEIYEAVYEEDILHWLQDRYPAEKALIAELKQLSRQSPIGASELLGKITRLITKERVVVAKPAFKEHAKIRKVEASSDNKNYKVYIEVTTPINELYVVELRAANAHTTIAKRRISLDVAYNVREIVVEFDNPKSEEGALVFVDGAEMARYNKDTTTSLLPTPIRNIAAIPYYNSSTTIVRGTYKVGDYYDDGTKQGVVFEVSEDGRHGKIVSLVQSKQQWCSEAEYAKRIETGATDQADGMTNQRIIKQIDYWRYKYPAFAWCADLGEGWYLPAIEESKKILLDDSVHDKVNRTLQELKAPMLFARGDKGWYWSSTESIGPLARGVFMYDGDTSIYCKNDYFYLRAVAVF